MLGTLSRNYPSLTELNLWGQYGIPMEGVTEGDVSGIAIGCPKLRKVDLTRFKKDIATTACLREFIARCTELTKLTFPTTGLSRHVAAKLLQADKAGEGFDWSVLEETPQEMAARLEEERVAQEEIETKAKVSARERASCHVVSNNTQTPAYKINVH